MCCMLVHCCGRWWLIVNMFERLIPDDSHTYHQLLFLSLFFFLFHIGTYIVSTGAEKNWICRCKEAMGRKTVKADREGVYCRTMIIQTVRVNFYLQSNHTHMWVGKTYNCMHKYCVLVLPVHITWISSIVCPHRDWSKMPRRKYSRRIWWLSFKSLSRPIFLSVSLIISMSLSWSLFSFCL